MNLKTANNQLEKYKNLGFDYIAIEKEYNDFTGRTEYCIEISPNKRDLINKYFTATELKEDIEMLVKSIIKKEIEPKKEQNSTEKLKERFDLDFSFSDFDGDRTVVYYGEIFVNGFKHKETVLETAKHIAKVVKIMIDFDFPTVTISELEHLIFNCITDQLQEKKEKKMNLDLVTYKHEGTTYTSVNLDYLWLGEYEHKETIATTSRNIAESIINLTELNLVDLTNVIFDEISSQLKEKEGESSFKTVKEANHSETAVKTRVAIFHNSRRKLNLDIAYLIRDIKNGAVKVTIKPVETVEKRLFDLIKELENDFGLMDTMQEMDEKDIQKLTIDNYTIENINKREKIVHLKDDDSMVAVYRDYKLGTKKYKKDLIK